MIGYRHASLSSIQTRQQPGQSQQRAMHSTETRIPAGRHHLGAPAGASAGKIPCITLVDYRKSRVSGSHMKTVVFTTFESPEPASLQDLPGMLRRLCRNCSSKSLPTTRLVAGQTSARDNCAGDWRMTACGKASLIFVPGCSLKGVC